MVAAKPYDKNAELQPAIILQRGFVLLLLQHQFRMHQRVRLL